MTIAWIYDASACVDCYMTAALGAPSDDPDYVPHVVPLSSVDSGERVETGHRFPLHDSDVHGDSLGFSRMPCAMCGSYLAGDRYAVSVWA